MKYTLILIVLVLFSGFSYSQELSEEEQKLYDMIMEYRESLGLSKIPLSGCLTTVAQVHAKDLSENHVNGKGCNMHSWSDQGDWTPCCYTNDHKRASCMWNKPKELTDYTGVGYEIAFWTSHPNAFAEDAIKTWKKSSGHNDVIVNKNTWSKVDWKAVGLGISGGYAVVWFGQKEDIWD